MQAALLFPEIDPVALQLGPLAIRWYSLAYIVGIFFARYWSIKISVHSSSKITPAILDSSISIMVIGIIIGGRLGHVILYDPAYYFSNPLEILKVWKGGMSFHGGFLGVILATWYHTHRNKVSLLGMLDVIAPSIGIGLFLGRMANFANGELWGRPTDVAWGMIFPHVDQIARHPSQIYEALLEGVLSFVILSWLAFRTNTLDKRGHMFAYSIILYALSRSFSEFFRVPDGMFFGITYGQAYSIPLLAFGLLLIWFGKNQNNPQK